MKSAWKNSSSLRFPCNFPAVFVSATGAACDQLFPVAKWCASLRFYRSFTEVFESKTGSASNQLFRAPRTLSQ
jgi:hypothetical protein